MIPKKHAPDLIRGVQRFSERIMLKQESRAAEATRDGDRAPRQFVFGFQSRASFCASASCSDDISPATWSRLFVAASRRGASLRREAERLNHMCAFTRLCSTPSPRA